jgi:flagellar biosynthesis/type III secretory pathway ATPase
MELSWRVLTVATASSCSKHCLASRTSLRVQAEVVGFRGDEVVLMPLGEATGIGPDAMVTPIGRPLAPGSCMNRVRPGPVKG